MAIELGLTLRVRARSDMQVLLWSEGMGEEPCCLNLKEEIRPVQKGWSSYIAGVLAGYQHLGWQIPGFEGCVRSTLPVGSGLSSSAALEVATATAVETLCERQLSLEQKALLCQQAEREFAHVPCGIMDQFAVTFGKVGHALLLDCSSHSMRYVPFADEEVSVLVINSGVKHSLADGEYARRRAECASAARLFGVGSLRDVNLNQWHIQNQR